MNEVSIIINGVRYDAVDSPKEVDFSCESCDLYEHCINIDYEVRGQNYTICSLVIGDDGVFKKTTKKFER